MKYMNPRYAKGRNKYRMKLRKNHKDRKQRSERKRKNIGVK